MLSFLNRLFGQLKIIVVCADPKWRSHDINFLQSQVKKAYRKIPNAPSKAEIEILFTNDQQMKKLKKNFLHQDKVANVLSFPNHHRHDAKKKFLGSIALGHDIIKKESRTMEKKFRNHLTHLAIHGLLHLLDFDHTKDSDAMTMEQLEITLLADIGIGNPYQ